MAFFFLIHLKGSIAMAMFVGDREGARCWERAPKTGLHSCGPGFVGYPEVPGKLGVLFFSVRIGKGDGGSKDGKVTSNRGTLLREFSEGLTGLLYM